VLGLLLAGCIALAGLRLVIAALVLSVCLAAIVGFSVRPRETIGLAIFLAALHCLQTRPVTIAVIGGIVLVACLIGKAIKA
jgi:branched-subunit amino acid transport protein